MRNNHGSIGSTEEFLGVAGVLENSLASWVQEQWLQTDFS